MKNYSIGLDLGVNNVGWSIVNNESKQIEKAGVYQFNASDSAEERRISRGMSRRYKRRATRTDDALRVFQTIGFPNQKTIDSNLLEKRVKGLHEKISPQDIVNIVCFIVKNRGYIPYKDENEGTPVELGKMFPCEFYYDRWKNSLDHKYRGLRLTVKNSDNMREVRQMLNTQKKYYPEITDVVINKLLGTDEEKGIINRKREFWQGPGSTKSLTSFGRFKTKEGAKEYERLKKEHPGYEKYLFEDKIKHCEIEPEERCASIYNYYAEVFELINDYTNISFFNIENCINQDCFIQKKDKTYRLNRKGIELILNYWKLSQGQYAPMFKKLFHCGIDNITGYKRDKDNKMNLAKMKFYNSMRRSFLTHNVTLGIFEDDTEENVNLYNQIVDYITLAPGTVEVLKMINNNVMELDENKKAAIEEVYRKYSSKLKYHALSELALKKSIQDMLGLEMNFMQVRRKRHYDDKAQKILVDKYIELSKNKEFPLLNPIFVDDLIASPQVRKTLRKSIRIINAIMEEQGCYPTYIAIESTKEMNGDERQKEINDIQAKQTQLRKDARSYLERHYPNQVTDKNIVKVMLYEEMDGRCPYCDKPVDLKSFINGSYEVEHILPLSQSSDDSYENKTISCAKCNKDKGDNTPFFWLKGSQLEFFINRIKSNKKISKVKKEHFLCEDNLTKYQYRFFSRNLRDTAYATSALVKIVQSFNAFLESQNKTEKIQTISTPGQLTHNIRTTYGLDKDRDDGVIPYHHAVDASIVAFLTTTKLGKSIAYSQNNPKFFTLPDRNKIMNEIRWDLWEFSRKKKRKNEYDAYVTQLKKIDDGSIFYSSEVNKDPNKKLANDGIYKFIKKEDDFYVVDQIADIYSQNLNYTRMDSLFNDSKQDTLMIYDNNRSLYEKLWEIYNKYYDRSKTGKDLVNPFELYCRERNSLSKEDDFIPAKHGIHSSDNKNSPIVTTLRYYSPVTIPYFLEKESINKKENTYIGFTGLTQYCTKVFYNKTKNRFAFLPIPSICVDFRTKKLKENHKFYRELYQKYIGSDEVEFLTNLYNGDYIEVQKKSGEMIYGNVSYFNVTYNRITLKNKSIFTTSDISFTLYHYDLLGNCKKKLTFEGKRDIVNV